jgi:hypothetical protein
MSDGGNKRWWSQPKNAVVPWTAAAFGLLLATAFGIAAGIQCLELQSHHLVIPTDNKGPNWAEIANLFLASTLAIVAILALGTIRQARHARIEAQTAQNALQMNELSRRWDDEVNRQVRTKVREYAKNGLPRRLLRSPRRFGVGAWTTARIGPDQLKECMVRLREDNDPEYRQLLTEPNLVEDLAILVQRGGIDFEIVDLSLGPTIAYQWSRWKATAHWLREVRNDPCIFREFEDLARQIRAKHPDVVEVDAAEEIVWTEFRG